MVKIRIGDDIAQLGDATREWVMQSVGRRQRDGIAVCVRVDIEVENICLHFATAACRTGGRAKELTSQERRVVDLWTRHNLMESDFAPQDVADFISGLRGLPGIR